MIGVWSGSPKGHLRGCPTSQRLLSDLNQHWASLTKKKKKSKIYLACNRNPKKEEVGGRNKNKAILLFYSVFEKNKKLSGSYLNGRESYGPTVDRVQKPIGRAAPRVGGSLSL